MKSIIQKDPNTCLICGAPATEEHHIFGGSLRKKSERYGLKVRLCHCCHNEPPNGVHHNKAQMDRMHKLGQQMAMEHYGWTVEQFRQEFYKNYL